MNPTNSARSRVAITHSAGWTRRGGYVLIGEGYRQKMPRAGYLAHLEAIEEEFLDHRGNVQAGIDAGLVPWHASVASADDWDEYEWKFSASIERYALEQPDEADIPAMLARIGAGATATGAGDERRSVSNLYRLHRLVNLA